MDVTSVGLLIDEKRAVLEKKLNNELIDDFDMEDLDKVDGRKDLMIIFKNPIDVKYLPEKLQEILGECRTKRDTE